MKIKALLTAATLVVAVWFAQASAGSLNNPARPGYQVAQNEQKQRKQRHQEQRGHEGENQNDQWYQGQRGHWYHENNRWQWRGATGDEWYQGQRGHWYQEPNGWQFGSAGMVCNASGCNCRIGGYIPPNGQGMVSRSNPNLFWACDSDGHNCHWARRPRC